MYRSPRYWWRRHHRCSVDVLRRYGTARCGARVFSQLSLNLAYCSYTKHGSNLDGIDGDLVQVPMSKAVVFMGVVVSSFMNVKKRGPQGRRNVLKSYNRSSDHFCGMSNLSQIMRKRIRYTCYCTKLIPIESKYGDKTFCCRM